VELILFLIYVLVLPGTLFIVLTAYVSNMREYRCGTMSEDWTWAPCIGLYIKALEGWADYIMHYPIITGREDYRGRWVACKMVCDTSAGSMNRWGFHRAGECPHSMYRTREEYLAARKGIPCHKPECKCDSPECVTCG